MTEARLTIDRFQADESSHTAELEISVTGGLVFDIDVQIQLTGDGGEEVFSHHIRQAGWDVAWLPPGRYLIRAGLGGIEPGQLQALLWSQANAPSPQLQDRSETTVAGAAAEAGGLSSPQWQLRSLDSAVEVSQLSWAKGQEDWFYRHFDHASRVITETFLANSPQLKGRILDVGCGDGITDLGVFLRTRPELLVGIDPFEGYQRLPEILAENQLDTDLLNTPQLRFEPHSGNDIPYPDDEFDVVLSWGSLEHIAGGYTETLAEITRVLKPGGLLFAHPGLYYGELGNHLNEFFEDPFIHLKLDEDELRRRVLEGQPRYMDRAGERSSPEQYWQWYTELNPIKVAEFEQQLQALGFEPWRVGLRTNDFVEYTPELQGHSAVDLCVSEIYGSWVLKN